MAARVLQNAVDLVDEAACERLGVNRTDLRCLDILERSGQMSAGQVAQESGVTTGAVTAVLDRLERAGYVRRLPDEEDRRKVLVEVTPLAMERGGAIYGPIGEYFAVELERLTDEELTLLRDYHTLATEFLTRHVAKLRAEIKTAQSPHRGRRASRS